jgi:hypothetical protein
VNVRELRPGLVRADNARKLTPAGLQAAWDYGIRTVLDLRSPGECADDVPDDPRFAYVRVPLSDFDRPERGEPEDKAEALRLWYAEHLEHNGAGIAAAIGAVADAEGGVLVHCLGGKDRTGIVSALLLRLRGASLEEIEDDYVRSEASLRRIFDVINAPAGVIGPVLAAVEEAHGSVREYLLSAGVTPEQLARLA